MKHWLQGSRTGKQEAAPAELPGLNVLVLNAEASTGRRIGAQRANDIVKIDTAKESGQS